MSNSQRIRVSIKPHNQRFLKQIAAQMECENLSEALNYLLLELRKMGYSFNAQFPQIQAEENPPVEAMPHSALAYQEDEVIARILSIGLEQF